jgi:hypothetical protein
VLDLQEYIMKNKYIIGFTALAIAVAACGLVVNLSSHHTAASATVAAQPDKIEAAPVKVAAVTVMTCDPFSKSHDSPGCANLPKMPSAVLTDAKITSTQGLLIRDAQISGQKLYWDMKTDFQLNDRQLSDLGVVAKGQTGLLAASIVHVLETDGFAAGMKPEALPVAFSCVKQSAVVITTKSASQKWVDQGCVAPTKI